MTTTCAQHFIVYKMLSHIQAYLFLPLFLLPTYQGIHTRQHAGHQKHKKMNKTYKTLLLESSQSNAED